MISLVINDLSEMSNFLPYAMVLDSFRFRLGQFGRFLRLEEKAEAPIPI